MDASLRSLINLPNTGLRLLYDPEQTKGSAAIFMQWCIAPEFIEFLKGQSNVWIVISIVDEQGREERVMSNIMDMQKIIQFHRSGVHQIRARLLWNRSAKQMKKTVSYVRRGLFTVDWSEIAADISGQSGMYSLPLVDVAGNANLEIDVSAQFFAPTIADWEKRWLTYFLGDMWDECDIRRRRLFAYTIQALLMGFLVPFHLIVRLALLLFDQVVLYRYPLYWHQLFGLMQYSTFEDFSLKNVDYGTGNASKEAGLSLPGAVAWFDRQGNSRPTWQRWALGFCWPVVHVGFAIIALGISDGSGFISAYFRVLGFAATVIALFACVYAVVWWIAPNIVRPIIGLIDRYVDYLDRISAHNAYTDMSCSNAPTVGLRQVRGSTIRSKLGLFYQDMKIKVCRPVQR